MRTNLHSSSFISAFLLPPSACVLPPPGRLDSGDAPYTGSAEFQATLWDAATNGNQVTTNNPASVAVNVVNGLFVLPLDFGANFPGADRWLRLEVRTTLGTFTTLSPRQPFTPTPYAIHSASAATAGSVTSNSVSVTQLATVDSPTAGQMLAYSGSGLVWTNPPPPPTGSAGWSLSGNSGTTPGSNFVGTTDNQPLELRVNGGRALRLEPGTSTNGAPNMIGGSQINFASTGVVGATIATGVGHVFNTGGAASRLTVGYGFVGIYVGQVNAAPATRRLLADTTHIEVNGTFNNNSDRNAKQDFAPIKPSQILDKVMHLPLSEWSYKDDPTTRHVGPMAQDFYSAFNVGTDDRHIAPIDEGGVAFAAIQGLNQKLERELKAKDARIAGLEARLEALEQTLATKLSASPPSTQPR